MQKKTNIRDHVLGFGVATLFSKNFEPISLRFPLTFESLWKTVFFRKNASATNVNSDTQALCLNIRQTLLRPLMIQPGNKHITQLLNEWGDGKPEAMQKLFPLVYDELRKMAQRHLFRERSDHTLQRTALVHEAFFRLIDQRDIKLQNRAHFFAIASQVMRRILVDHARARNADKRGGGARALSIEELAEQGQYTSAALDGIQPHSSLTDVDVLSIDSALTKLELFDVQQAKIVELRFFGGLSIEETADALDISTATVKRDWAVARLWFRRELAADFGQL
jgi:RNA polymerase sigma factor (TIGR02999 family)